MSTVLENLTNNEQVAQITENTIQCRTYKISLLHEQSKLTNATINDLFRNYTALTYL